MAKTVSPSTETGTKTVAQVWPDATDVTAAGQALNKAKTKAEVITVWKAWFGKVGHKRLGRMLIGLPAEKAKRE